MGFPAVSGGTADSPQGEAYNPHSANQYYIDMEAIILACFIN